MDLVFRSTYRVEQYFGIFYSSPVAANTVGNVSPRYNSINGFVFEEIGADFIIP